MSDFKSLRALYPRRSGGQGWIAAERLVAGHIRNGVPFDEILDGTKAYAKWCDYSGKTGTELVKQARTFYGRDMWWGEDYEIPESTYKRRTPEVVSEDQRKRDAEAGEAHLEHLKRQQLKVVK